MFNSPHLVYCNCSAAPLLYCPSVHSMWNCSIPNPSSVYRTSLDAMATHSGASVQEENSEAVSLSRNLKFGIENILYGPLQSDHHHGAHRQFSHNQELGYISHQPFAPPMRTSSRPWCRPVFTQLQRRGLEKRFQVTKYVTKRERLQIGAMLGLSETQVKVWFQNRRTKWRHEAARKEEKQKEQALNKAKENQKHETSEARETQETDEEPECLSSNNETSLEES